MRLLARIVFVSAFVSMVVAACGGGDGYVLLEPEGQALRTSMAIRGLRPEPAALREVRADPAQLEAWVDRWLDSPAFGETIRDMHAEQLLIRTDVDDQLPAYGPLADFTTIEIHEGTVEAPLKLIEKVVLEGRPYTEIVTADWLLVSQPYALVHGLGWEPGGPAWQEARWRDARPKAGILSDSELWRRHRSAGSNFHRGRANLVASVLLCEDFATRDVPVEGGIDLSDELLVAAEVRERGTCVGCHQALDPLAGYFWGFRHQLKARAVRTAYELGCQWPTDDPADLPGGHGSQDDFCYPLRFYQAELENDWRDWDLRAPAYFGEPAADLGEVGQRIATDHRFATCTARRFWSYFAQTPVEDVPPELVTELTDTLLAEGWDARALVRSIVLHPRFLATEGPPGVTLAGVQHARPEQLARSLAALTGYRWLGRPEPTCTLDCWGTVDMMRTDRFGFRSLAGGIDGLTVLHPTHSATPGRRLTLERFAAEAAAALVRADSAVPPGQRRLLGEVTFARDEPEAALRAQIVELYLRVSAEVVEPDSAAVTLALGVYEAGLAETGDPRRAWTLLLSALLQDDRMELY